MALRSTFPTREGEKKKISSLIDAITTPPSNTVRHEIQLPRCETFGGIACYAHCASIQTRSLPRSEPPFVHHGHFCFDEIPANAVAKY